MRGQAVLTVGLFLTVAAPAGAATVQGTSSCGKESCVYGLVFRASPGERNVVTTERAAPNAVIFRDAGAPIALSRGCQAEADGSVRCVNGTVDDALSVEVH